MAWQDWALGGLTGSGLVVALASWLGKVWASRILAKDRAKYQKQVETLLQDLRTRDSKELFVHRLQFEKEFELYKELWRAVLTLGRAGRHFRNVSSRPFKPYEDIHSDFCEANNALSSLVYDNRPFYAPSVFDIAKDVLDSVHEINRSDWWRREIEQKSKQLDKKADKLDDLDMKIEAALNEIGGLIDCLCEAIRARIWSTTEKGWDRDDQDTA